MIWKTYITYSVLLVVAVTGIKAQEQENNALTVAPLCPDVQYACPPCGVGEKCVYPNENGCPNAGIPVCQADNCKIRCLIKRLPCPEECPDFCNYSGPACCPFLGEPVCEPVCQTLVACKVTPCPADCSGDCYYPNASTCCPKAGVAVCNNPSTTILYPSISTISPPIFTTSSKHTRHRKGGSGYKSGGKLGAHHGHGAQTLASIEPPSVFPVDLGYECDPTIDKNCLPGKNYQGKHSHGGGKHSHGSSCSHGGKGHSSGKKNSHGDTAHVEGVTIEVIGVDASIDISKSVDGISLSTPIMSDIIFCAQYIVPCPADCPYNCVYPMDAPCPYTNQPWCPTKPPTTITNVCETETLTTINNVCETETLTIVATVYLTESPTYTPSSYTNIPITRTPRSLTTNTLTDYSNPFASSSGNQSATLSTTTTDSTVTSPICPLIFVPCPKECPTSCLRQKVPCPFTVEGYCPGSSPTTTPTIVGPCPLYVLACPACSANLKCTRATTGRCPNTNSPYCASLSQTSQTPSHVTINPITPTLITEFPLTPTYLPSAVPNNWASLLRYEDSDNRENAQSVLDVPM